MSLYRHTFTIFSVVALILATNLPTAKAGEQQDEFFEQTRIHDGGGPIPAEEGEALEPTVSGDKDSIDNDEKEKEDSGFLEMLFIGLNLLVFFY